MAAVETNRYGLGKVHLRFLDEDRSRHVRMTARDGKGVTAQFDDTIYSGWRTGSVWITMKRSLLGPNDPIEATFHGPRGKAIDVDVIGDAGILSRRQAVLRDGTAVLMVPPDARFHGRITVQAYSLRDGEPDRYSSGWTRTVLYPEDTELRMKVYASIFAAVLASIPGVDTRLVCFDTAVLDLTEQLSDPVDVLFGIQLGGGTDINGALAYCERHVEQPFRTNLVLISDLFEGGDAESMLARVAALKQSGVNVIVLLALSDDGHAAYNTDHAGKIAGMDCPVFACTPDQFPDLMAVALTGRNVAEWAAANDINLIRGTVNENP